MEQKILVPLDGSALSERALEPAEKIARAIGYEMVLFRVIDTPLETSPEAEPEEERRAVFRRVRDQIRQRLVEAVRKHG